MQMGSQNLKSLEHLKLRPDDFERLLRDIGFGPPEHLGKVGEGGTDYLNASCLLH